MQAERIEYQAHMIDQRLTPKGRVLEATALARRREQELAEVRAEFPQILRAAQAKGATIRELMEWTGYSQRTIFYLLKR